MNWCYQPDDKLIERSQVDIGMAVAADDGGLVVPILRGCESRELAELNGDWKDLVERARKRRLKPEEYTGSTFQISNMGMFDVSHFDAIATPGTGRDPGHFRRTPSRGSAVHHYRRSPRGQRCRCGAVSCRR